ncbi:hypothetical protein TVAG_489590 [Trichomonas vaginalis G3]|uniref:Uncharacterized protein n=1 Tax=Trichomonas vaginalis (strain ATCC PRA-98 / G3) TaxID=412133 RepID=A2FEJ5_TRIV3|nr:hypothetical protein TVAGG3_0878120 [Trichomonas vaginalis G3]EAX96677.1 hypothetical protein TVAG_489590 [Trichomonas vaginalis G3]KAI5501838.1 hypothetical protein TVAGG3_0878120 [Trichomonas vaginalis G3]|eukprot:XP_001309607.1 hypothetical protein [Trichomonas vaginalis G3]
MPNFVDYVTSTSFMNLFMNNDSKTLDFVIAHFDQIMQLGFRTVNGKKNLVTPCLQIIRNIRYPFLTDVYQKTNLASFLTNYPIHCRAFSNASHHIYFLLLPNYIYTQTRRLMSPFSTDEFFSSIIQVCDLFPANEFLRQTISTAGARTLSIFDQISFCPRLTQCLFYNELAIPAIEILTLGLANRLQYQVVDTLMQNQILQNLIELSMKSKTPEYFGFLRSVFQISQKNPSFYKAKQLSQKITEYKDEFCSIVLRLRLFTRISEVAAYLVIDIIEFDHIITDPFIEMTRRLVIDFFDFPAHTFLHQTVLSLFRMLLKTGHLTPSIISRSGLPMKLVDAYDRREGEIGVSFWAETRELAEIVNMFGITQFGITQDVWRKKVMNRVNAEMAIIQKDYGGYTPRISCNGSILDLLLSFIVIFVTFLGIMWVFRKRIQ